MPQQRDLRQRPEHRHDAARRPATSRASSRASGATDPKGKYGGTDNAWNCGELQYVAHPVRRLHLGANNELNGLTLGGCGTQTKLSYIQVHRGLDDGIEFFGGTANMDHILVSGVDDDGLDWDFGWSGKVQFLIVHQAYGTGDKGFEADNFVDTESITPRSNPEIWNATMIGQTGLTAASSACTCAAAPGTSCGTSSSTASATRRRSTWTLDVDAARHDTNNPNDRLADEHEHREQRVLRRAALADGADGQTCTPDDAAPAVRTTTSASTRRRRSWLPRA